MRFREGDERWRSRRHLILNLLPSARCAEAAHIPQDQVGVTRPRWRRRDYRAGDDAARAAVSASAAVVGAAPVASEPIVWPWAGGDAAAAVSWMRCGSHGGTGARRGVR